MKYRSENILVTTEIIHCKIMQDLHMLRGILLF
jgi:hypothetical protein